MKTTATALLAATLLFTGAAHAETLKVCAEGAYPPFSLTTESGDLEGFDIDIANAICDEAGMTCEITATEWDGIIPALLEKKCDAIIASMSITPERKERIDFSEKYYNTPAKFVARADTDLVDTPEGLEDAVVGVQRGTVHQDFMEAKFPDVELKLYGTQDEVYLDLQSGRLDVIMQDSVAADDGFLKTPAGANFAFLGGSYADPEIHGAGAGIGVRKEDTELRDKLSAAIAALRENGKYKEINDKYFDFDIY
jgi:lysine-arginine-ornithine-binding protein